MFIYRLITYCYFFLSKKAQRQLRKSLFQQQQNDDIHKIEFSNGEVQKLSNIEIQTNRVNLVDLGFILIELLKSIIQLENLITLVILFITLLGNAYEQDITQKLIVYYSLSLYLSYILFYTFTLILVYRERKFVENKINNQNCTVFAKFPDITEEQIQHLEQVNEDSIELQQLEQISWKQLKVGQIVCLHYLEQSPADILILDSSNESVLINYERRFPCQCTYVNPHQQQKGSVLDFITKLNGSVQLEFQSNRQQGIIKLKNDPKTTQFTNKNIILRGEILDCSEWIFGMAIRVGDECQGVQSFIKGSMTQNSQRIMLCCIILQIIFFIPFVIYQSIQNIDQYFFSCLTYSMLFLPQNVQLFQKIWQFIIIFKQNRNYHKYQNNQFNDDILKTQPLNIVQEDEQKVLIPIKNTLKHIISNTNQNIRKLNSQKLNGYLNLSLQNIQEFYKTDYIIIENPFQLFKQKPHIVSLIEGNKQYKFDYEKIRQLVTKSSPKQNFDKLLIETIRQNTQDEQKAIDIEQLISEKRMPTLRGSQEQIVVPQIQTKQLSETSKTPNIRTNSMAKKKSSRYLFDQSFSRQSQKCIEKIENNQGGIYNSPGPLQKQRSQFLRQRTQLKFGNQSNSMQTSLNQNLSDKLLGDCFNEQDFFELLINKENIMHNEILIMLLLVNNIMSYYQDGQLKLFKDNQYDDAILDFAGQFNYTLTCSTQCENTRPEFCVKQIIKKVIAIDDNLKTYDILAINRSSDNKKNKLSILVRDPESFLLEEGSLLYTRIEYNQTISPNKFTDQLQDMLWNGQKCFVYYKTFLDPLQTESLLNQLTQTSQEIAFQEYENKSEVCFAIGIKNIFNSLTMSSNNFISDPLKHERFFQTLIKNFKHMCLITNQNYEELLIFIRQHQIILNKEQIIHLNENDIQQLQYKFRQQIQLLLDEPQLQHYYIINQKSFDTIIGDDYLRYHFIFLIEFSIGLGAYDFTSKGKLAKLLKTMNSSIVSIGNSLDNQKLFKNSDLSWSVDSKLQPMHSQFISKNIKQIFKQIFYNQNFEKWIDLFESQIYRNLLFAICICSIVFSFSDLDIFYLLIFYLFFSNCITLSIQIWISNQNIEQNQFQIFQKIFTHTRQFSFLKKVIEILLITLIDFTIFILIQQSLLTTSVVQTQQTVLLFVTLELLEKLKLFLKIIQSNNLKKQILQISLLFILEIIICILFAIVQSIYDDFSIKNIFNIKGFIQFIFIFIFVFGISYNSGEFINYYFGQQYNYHLLNFEEIKDIERQIESEYSFDQYCVILTQQIKKITDKFENKDILDEQIVRLLKGDQHLADQLELYSGFSDQRTEKDFQEFFKLQSQKKYGLLWIFLFYDISLFIMHLYILLTDVWILSLLISSVIQLGIQLFIVILQFRLIQSKTIQQILQIIAFISRFSFKILNDLLHLQEKSTFDEFFFHFMFILAISLTTQPKIIFFVFSAILFLSISSEFITNAFLIDYENNLLLAFCLIKLGFILIEMLYPLLQMVMRLQFLQRSSYIYLNRLTAEQKKVNSILSLLMPRFIQERMNKGQIQISQDQGDVTILFCDIYQFDKVIREQKEKILDFLDTLYRSFDQMCQQYDMLKIETVGKTYMAAAGLKDYDLVINQKNTNSTVRALETAIQMIEIAKTIKYGDNQNIILKIGIHYGRVIAGVIGMHKPQFSLIGDTVNTTSRVCSTGEAGFITLSETAYFNVKSINKYRFEEKEVAAKGKGTIKTYKLLNISLQGWSSNSKKIITQDLIRLLPQQIQQQPIQQSVQQNFKKRASILNPIIDTSKSPKLILRELQRDNQFKQNQLKITRRKILFEQDIKEMQDKIAIKEEKSKSRSKSISINDADKQSQISKLPQNNTIFNNSTQLKNQRLSEEFTQVKKFQPVSQTTPLTMIQLPQQITQISFQPPAIYENLGRQSNNQSSILARPSQNLIPENEDEQNTNTNKQIQRQSLKRKGTILLTSNLVNTKKAIIKSNTKIIYDDQQEVDKQNKQNYKPIKTQPQEILDSKQIVPYLHLNEIEVQKLQNISKLQKKIDIQKLQNIIKFKFDQDNEYNYLKDGSQYNSDEQLIYYQIYEEFCNQEQSQLKHNLLFLTIILICKNSLYFLYNLDTDQSINLLIVCLCQIIICIFLVFITYKNSILNYLKNTTYIFGIIICILNFIILYFSQQKEFDIILQTISIGSLYYNLFYLQIFNQKDKIKLMTFYLILNCLLCIYQKYILCIILFGIYNIGLTYYSQTHENQLLVKNYRMSQQLQNQISKYQNMLQYLMPPHALKRLLYPDKEQIDMDILENTTVLFADIAGFTKYSSSVEPETVVEMLRNLFQSFDTFCQLAQVYKLYTIGDCYVCMGVMDCYNRDPVEEAQRVLVFGLKMIQIINDYNKDPQYQHLNMRIGVHTGKIMGGVVGTDVVRYDIYGEDVTIANMMESNGSEGRMMVSEITKNLIESEYDDFNFEFVKEVRVQDISLKTYYVTLD